MCNSRRAGSDGLPWNEVNVGEEIVIVNDWRVDETE
jgi:hypothetical protein